MPRFKVKKSRRGRRRSQSPHIYLVEAAGRDEQSMAFFLLTDNNLALKFHPINKDANIATPRICNPQSDQHFYWLMSAQEIYCEVAPNNVLFASADYTGISRQSEVAQTSPTIKKAVGKLLELSKDERARMLFEAREKERRDNIARERGALAKGTAIGRSEEKKEVAQKLLKQNISIEIIAKATSLSCEQIEQLRPKIQSSVE